MINIYVFSNVKAWSKKIKKKELFFKKICKAFPKKYQFSDKKVSLTLMLSNNKNIKRLNRNFRNKDKATDILSFPFENNSKIINGTYIGDIIISYNFINKPKSQKLKTFKEKLIKLFIHGFLHLLDFNHVKEKECKKMEKEEQQIYKSVISKLN